MTNVETIVGSAQHNGQTFLVGETVYLRMAELTDSEYVSMWRSAVFPWSPERARKWMEDEFNPEAEAVYLVRRKADDVIVGSIRAQGWGQDQRWLEPYASPLLGERGQIWLAEASVLLAQHTVGESRVSAARFRLRADSQTVIRALEAVGGREVARYRGLFAVAGTRVDVVTIELLNPEMVARLGDPRDQELPRSGTGESRPVIPPVDLHGQDPPKNAVVVGPRVYLRPWQKGDGEILSPHLRAETDRWVSDGRNQMAPHTMDKWMLGLQKEDPPSWLRFVVCLRENDQPIGSVGIEVLDLLNSWGDSESELNAVAYRGDGYGTEAKHLLFHYAFNVLGLHSLRSFVIYPNTRSAAALRKQGYREAGRISWFYPKESVVTFELLADEWRALPRVDVNDLDKEGSAA